MELIFEISNIRLLMEKTIKHRVIEIGFCLVRKTVGQTRNLEFVEFGVPSRHFMTHVNKM